MAYPGQQHTLAHTWTPAVCLENFKVTRTTERERERGKLQVVVVVAVTVLVVVFILSLKTLVKSAPGHGHRATESHPFLASTTPA